MKKTERKFRDGDVIFKESDVSNSMYFLVEGIVELSKAGERGQIMLAMLNPGEMFGEMALIDASPRMATAIAIGKTRLVVIPKTAFSRVMTESGV